MKWAFLLALPVLWLSCSSASEKECANPDACFQAFSDSFVEAMLVQFPEWASSVGRYEHADKVTIPSAERRAEDIAFYQHWLDSLNTYAADSLSDDNRVDWILIQNQIQSSIWYRTVFKSYEWNPSEYNVAGSIDLILTGSFAPLTKRLELIMAKLQHVPDYYEAAKTNINNPTPEHTALAINQNSAGLMVFESVIDSAHIAGWSEERVEELHEVAELAASATQGYVDWLKSDVLPTATRSFRVGPELYAPKFENDLMASYTPDQIYERAVEEKDDIHTEMLRLTQQLWPAYFNTKPSSYNLASVKQMIGEISKQHVDRDSFLTAIEEQLAELDAFVKEKDLLTLDPDKPLVVRPTPEYARGVAGAGIDAPGPFETGRNTYYNVTPLDNYTDEQAESWLREYNFYQLQILNIHEAIPGHYTQLVYSNKSPSLIKSLFGNGTMVEGWACYTEKMMLEEGYGKDVDEMWLIYYKWRLRILCNTLIDIGIQTKNMTREGVMKLLNEEAFQESAEAEGKWKRAQYTSVQLCSYYIGLTEIYDLREECRAIEGADFDLKKWHEEFLSYGSAPVKLIRELMLANLKKAA